MLKKLIKYEILSTSKFYLSLYAVVMGLALLNKCFNVNSAVDLSIISIPRGILMIAYVMIITAMAVITFILGITRFTQNLLSDEGYLMFTLPVKRSDLIISKVLTASLWSIMGGIVATISVFILTPLKVSIEFVTKFVIPQLIEYVGLGNLTLYIIEFFMVIVLAAINLYMLVYLSIAIGHTFKKNKTFAAFGCFFAISLIMQTVISVVGSFINWDFSIYNLSIGNWVHITMLSIIIWAIITSSIYFFATNYILVNKLNLE